MSLRRSPRRTEAFLAANRANAQKSTGPRTALGKAAFRRQCLRTGERASSAFWPRVLSHSELAEFHALRQAIERAVSTGSEDQRWAGTFGSSGRCDDMPSATSVRCRRKHAGRWQSG